MTVRMDSSCQHFGSILKQAGLCRKKGMETLSYSLSENVTAVDFSLDVTTHGWTLHFCSTIQAHTPRHDEEMFTFSYFNATMIISNYI